jgi:hypothetical protein
VLGESYLPSSTNKGQRDFFSFNYPFSSILILFFSSFHRSRCLFGFWSACLISFWSCRAACFAVFSSSFKRLFSSWFWRRAIRFDSRVSRLSWAYVIFLPSAADAESYSPPFEVVSVFQPRHVLLEEAVLAWPCLGWKRLHYHPLGHREETVQS